MVTITQAVTSQQRALAAREALATRRLMDAYRLLWRGVEANIARYDRFIAEAIERGEPVNPSWLRQQTWYRQLQGSIDAELQRFGTDAVRVMALTQREAVNAAAEAVRLFREAIGDPFAGRVNPGALERWVSTTRPDSPLRGVLDRYGTRAAKAIEDGITEGLGAGEGVGTIVRRIGDQVGPRATEARLATIVRTESMRAHRGAFADAMRPLQDDGIITGYRWLAAKSPRTCIACIARDGRITKTYPTDQHVACRCVAQPVVDPAIVPGGTTPEPGSAWFARQDAETQRRMLPNASAYDAYKRGEITLDDLVGVRQNRTWGNSVFVRSTPKPAKRPRRGAAAPVGDEARFDYGKPRSVADTARQYVRDIGTAKEPTLFRSEASEWWGNYKATGYMDINARARGITPRRGFLIPTEDIDEAMREMDSLFPRFAIDAPTRVYRGTSFTRGFNPEPSDWASIQPGSVITDGGYLSTTFDPKVAAKFGYGEQFGPGTTTYAFEIKAPGGAPYVPGDAFGEDTPEAEMIFPRGSRLRVTNVTRTTDAEGDVVRIEADLIPGETPT